MSKNEGKKFEEDIKNSIPSDIYYMRLKDSASSFGKDSSQTRFTLSNPFDMLSFYKRHLFTIELKSVKGTSIPIQITKDEPIKQIKYGQIVGLTEASKTEGIISGFIFNFRNRATFWMAIADFNKFLSETTKKSINIVDILKYNGLELKGNKKRTRYTYDIKGLFNLLIAEKGGQSIG